MNLFSPVSDTGDESKKSWLHSRADDYSNPKAFPPKV